jgi:hypothetical protein
MMIRPLLLASLASLAACAGATPASDKFVNQPGGGSGGGGAGKATGGDATFDVGPTDIKGVLFQPEALGEPGMPMVTAKKKLSLDKHRAELTKAKDPVVKQAEAEIIATMLYEQSKTQTGDALKKTLTDARQVLRDTAADVGPDKVDDSLLRMLGTYEVKLEDWAAAEKAWGDLVAKAPKDKEEPSNRAWWVYTLLKQFKTQDAVAALGSEPLTEKQAEFAYVEAWTSFRSGNMSAAYQAIIVALKGWGDNAGAKEVENEALRFAARSGVPMQAALKDLEPLIAKGAKDLDYKLYAELGLKSYQYAGRWADGIAAIDKALNCGAKVPAEDVPKLRYEQSDYAIRLDDPDAVAKYATAALQGVNACGAGCPTAGNQELVKYIAGTARLLGVLFANDNDPRYYAPAVAIYNAVVPMMTFSQKDQEDTARDKATVDQWKAKLKPTDGKHDKGAIGVLLSRHNQEVQACYEQVLSGNPKLGGTLTVRLEADQTGAIKGASTEPKGGVANLAAVASCVADHARGWKLPTHGAPGITRISLSFALAPKPGP